MNNIPDCPPGFQAIDKIIAWANTPKYVLRDNVVQVQHYSSQVYFYFRLENKVWLFTMTSFEPKFFSTGEEEITLGIKK